MFKFLQTPKGLIITGVVLLILVLLVTYNWGKISAWFAKPSAERAKKCRTVCPDGTIISYPCDAKQSDIPTCPQKG